MILLCYIFPPLAVLLMGRPFSAVLNFFLTGFGWIPGVKHALVCYADHKSGRSVSKITKAINDPDWFRAQQKLDVHRASAVSEGRSRRSRREVVEVVVYDNPHVGKGGTFFRTKSN